MRTTVKSNFMIDSMYPGYVFLEATFMMMYCMIHVYTDCHLDRGRSAVSAADMVYIGEPSQLRLSLPSQKD